MNVYLIGYRCTGKSTVGRLVAARLRRRFVDADDYLEEREGRTIREIFDVDGEPHFRDLESRYLEELAREKDLVVATGGGVILRPENVRRMKESGCLVLLQTDARTIHQRLQADSRTASKRPRLTTAAPFDEIVRLLAQRAPLYQAAAEITLESTKESPEAIADAVAEYLEAREEKP